MRRRDLAVAAAVAVLVSLLTQAVFAPRLSGVSIDLLFWLRQTILPSAAGAAAPVVIVAIDEESQKRAPFSELPHVMWTPQIAKVLTAMVDGGARTVGFDAIFATSGDQIAPGFDHDFLVALHHAAQQGHVVLGEAQQQLFPIHPFPAQIFAVGGPHNVRALNAISDNDSIVRRLPLMLNRVTSGSAVVVPEPTLFFELAIRATGSAPVVEKDGSVTFAGRTIPEGKNNAVLLNFAGPDAIPTYSLADLYACAEAGNIKFFEDHFAGRTVLLGAMLDVEDRELTSARLITAPEHPASGERCVYPPMTGLFRQDLVRNTVPGVYVLATGVANLLAGNSLSLLGTPFGWAIVLLMALTAAALSQLLAPSRAAIALGMLASIWLVVAVIAFRQDLVLPLFTPPLAAGLSLAVLLGYRFAVSDRDRRLLRSTFGLYLAPALVDRMMEKERLPELGGEMRTVTVLFSDIAGFSQLAEDLLPGTLVELMNAYLTAMTDIIEQNGGYVDKYIGDAIVALFGAPMDDPAHARQAVRATLACQNKLAAMNSGEPAFAGRKLLMRIGLNSGEALVGNIGSRRRFNYTAMGDTVNLASRLEGANKFYGTSILASESVRQGAGEEFLWREVDRVRVMGRDQPVRLFVPQGKGAAIAESVQDTFAAALATYRAGTFDSALAQFESIAARDPVAAAFVRRLRDWLAEGPPQPWDGVTDLESK